MSVPPLSYPTNAPLLKRNPLRDAAAYLLTFSLLALCTWGLFVLHGQMTGLRPYTILYLIPVAIGAALLGTRGGLIAAALALVLARVFLLNDAKHGTDVFLTFPSVAEGIEFISLLAGTLTVAIVTGSLRSVLGTVSHSREQLKQSNEQLAAANARLVEGESERRAFNRDVLQAVTGGKLRLVEPNEMPPPDLASGPPRLSVPLNAPPDATRLRHVLTTLACDLGMDDARVFDLCTGTTEAAANAIKHGAGGEAQVWTEPNAIIVLVADKGAGIAPAHLARATLEAGYSTRVSLGMGFHLMLQTSDVLALCTTPQGTTVLLRVAVQPAQTDQETLLARYVGL